MLIIVARSFWLEGFVVETQIVFSLRNLDVASWVNDDAGNVENFVVVGIVCMGYDHGVAIKCERVDTIVYKFLPVLELRYIVIKSVH